jgi:hypothetical protein
MFGQTCVVGRRTAAHLDFTKERLEEEHPGRRRVLRSAHIGNVVTPP